MLIFFDYAKIKLGGKNMFFLFSKFKLKKWNKLSYEKRFKCFVAVEKKVAKEFNISPIKLELNYDENWNCYGAFSVSNGKKRILLNSRLIEDPRLRFHVLETISHETRHAYQFSVVNKDLRWFEFTAKKWKRNWQGYFSASGDSLMYNNQSIERDAQKYSIKFLKRYRWKYRNEKDFKETFDAVFGRYDTADDKARQRYGIFYKWKIERNIRKKSRENN